MTDRSTKESQAFTGYSSTKTNKLKKLQDELGNNLDADIIIFSAEGSPLVTPFMTSSRSELSEKDVSLKHCCNITINKVLEKKSSHGEYQITTCSCGTLVAVHHVYYEFQYLASWCLLQSTRLSNNNEIRDNKDKIRNEIEYQNVDKGIQNTSIQTKFEQSVKLFASIADCLNELIADITGAKISSDSNQQLSRTLESVAFKISQLGQGNLSLSTLLHEIKNVLADYFHAESIQFALANSSNDKVCLLENDLEIANSKHFISSGSIMSYVLEKKCPLLVSSAAIELMTYERIITDLNPVPVSWLSVPILINDTVKGLIILQSFSSGRNFNEDDKHDLVYLTKQISFTIQRINNEEALIKAKNEAEESSRLKSSLLANMSHELRTPMTGILGFSEILHDELEEDRLKNMASTIYKSANRLMTTLNSIMDLSVIESNRTTLMLHSVNVRSIILQYLQTAYSVANDKGLYIRTSVSPNINVLADEKLLGQLIHHLIDNAIKFTIDGGVSISTFTTPGNSSEVTIKISDTGIGIAPEHHDLIFEEFRQVSEGLSRTFEGSGLGLSLVRKIAKLLNAQVRVESVQEKGSDFYVTLPSSAPVQKSQELETEKVEVINTTRLGRGSVPEVLIVEDNEINRRLAALYLRELCNIDMAENGYMALSKIKSKKYDAILMDINLGAGPNGIHVAQEIRMIDDYKDVPIIAVTGYTLQGDREKLLASGCSHYVPKPYDKRTLIKLFSGLLYKIEVK